MNAVILAARRVVAEVAHALVMADYWVRPYDMHLDARRWRWQRSGRQRSHDALAALTPEQRAQLNDGIRASRDRRRDEHPGAGR